MFEDIVCKVAAILYRPTCVNTQGPSHYWTVLCEPMNMVCVQGRYITWIWIVLQSPRNFKVKSRERSSTHNLTLIARFMGPTWGPSWVDRTHLGPMLAPWTLLSWIHFICQIILEFCTKHGSDTVVFCAEVHSDWATEKQRCAYETSRYFSLNLVLQGHTVL